MVWGVQIWMIGVTQYHEGFGKHLAFAAIIDESIDSGFSAAGGLSDRERDCYWPPEVKRAVGTPQPTPTYAATLTATPRSLWSYLAATAHQYPRALHHLDV